MREKKCIALVAHDNRKADLIEWVEWNYRCLLDHSLICTGTTGKLVEAAIQGKIQEEGNRCAYPEIRKLLSGPLGGDQQLGSMIAEGKIDVVIFFWDPMQPHPHDVDVKALLRIAVVYNVAIACNRSTADFIISSPLTHEKYQPVMVDYSEYLDRDLADETECGAGTTAPH